MAQMFLPVLSHFQNENPWSASAGRMRYRILPVPAPEPEAETGTLTVQVWEGPWAYEFSTVEETKTFPLNQEGLDALPQWLTQWADTINARPKRSMAEDDKRRTEPPTQ